MPIEAINGVKLNNNNIHFESKRKNRENCNVSYPQSPLGTTVKTIPVVVLMAMNPALLNANLPEYETNLNKTEITAPERSSNPEKTYIISPQEVQQNKPLSSFVKPEYIIYQRRFQAEGKNWTMYYYNMLKDQKPNYVMEIVLIPDDYKINRSSGGTEMNKPPTIKKLIYHKTGDSREFEGALVNEIRQESDGNFYRVMREMKLPDDVANEINHLLSGDTKFQPNPNLVKSFTIKSTLDMEPTTKSKIIII